MFFLLATRYVQEIHSSVLIIYCSHYRIVNTYNNGSHFWIFDCIIYIIRFVDVEAFIALYFKRIIIIRYRISHWHRIAKNWSSIKIKMLRHTFPMWIICPRFRRLIRRRSAKDIQYIFRIILLDLEINDYLTAIFKLPLIDNTDLKFYSVQLYFIVKQLEHFVLNTQHAFPLQTFFLHVKQRYQLVIQLVL